MVAIPQRPRAPQASEQAPDCTTYEAEHALVVHMGTSFSDTAPERHVLSLDAFLAQLVQAPRVGAKDGSFFQTIEYEPGARRDKEHILHALTYVADIDRGDLSEQDIRDTFDGWRAAAYTTWSSGPLATDDEAAACADCRRSSDGRCKPHNGRNWRVVLPFSHPAAAPLFEAVHDHHFVPLLGDDLGDESRKVAQLWYLPAVPAGREADHIAFQLEGEMFDPREYLELAQPRGNGADAATAPKDCNHAVIQAWNAAHTLPALLEAHGYEFVRKGAKAEQWRHPGSTSGSAAAWLYRDCGKIYAHSAGDPLRPTSVESNRKAGKRDSFDAMRILDCGGDWARAFRHAEVVLGIEPADVSGASAWPEPLDLVALARVAPAPPTFIIEDWLPVGYATLLAGHGGVGKSGIALYLAVCIALGLPFFGLTVKRGRVLYLSCEDRTGVLHWRLAQICAHLGVALADLAGHLDVVDLVGHDALMWTPHVLRTQEPTPAMLALRERVTTSGSQVIMVDGISDTYGGNENARAEVKAYINALLGLVDAESGALMLIGHIAKLSATGGATTEGYSGSTGWHNACRARWYLYPESRQDEVGAPAERTGDLILELQKSNLGRTEQSLRFTWDDDVRLFTGRRVNAETGRDRLARERRERAGIMAALCAVVDAGDYVPAAASGQRTALHVLSVRPEFPDSLRGGAPERRRFWRQIEALRAMGEIKEGSIARADRHKVTTLEPVNTTSEGTCGHAGNDE